MTTFWVSQGKHWCKICKLWLQPDKMSILNHERGKKHKEIEAEYMKDIRKTTRGDQREKDDLDSQLAAIEKAALEQYNLTDVQRSGLSAAGPSSAAGAPRPTPVPPAPAVSASGAALPAGWSVQLGPQGVPFYYDANTRSSHWTLPAHMQAPQPHARPPPPPPPAIAAGWACASAPDGRPYWYNSSTQQSSWQPPSGAQPGGATAASGAPATSDVADAPAAAPPAAAAAPSAEREARPAPPPEAAAAAAPPPPAEPAVEEATGLGGWTTVAVRVVEELAPDSDAEYDDDDDERRARAKGAANAAEALERRARAAAGRARSGEDAVVASANGASRETWADIAQRIDEDGAGGDEAALDAQGLLLGDNLVAHLQSHFPTKPRAEGAEASAAAAPLGAAGAATAAAADEAVPEVEFKRRKVSGVKASARRKPGSITDYE